MRIGQNLRFEVGSVTYTGTGDSTSNNIATIVGSTVAGVVVVMIIPSIIFIVVFFMRRTATKYLVQRETDDSLRGT